MVIMITVISNRRILNKATIGLMRIPHNITTKEEIHNMANNKMLTKDHLHNKDIHPSNSSTQGSRATQDSNRATVLLRAVQVLSILTIHRDKGSSMGVIDQHSLDHHSHPSRGLMDMIRDSMEITSSKKVLTFQ
jgi:hypothetical protein